MNTWSRLDVSAHDLEALQHGPDGLFVKDD